MAFLVFSITKFLPSQLGTADSQNDYLSRRTKLYTQKVMTSQLCSMPQFPTTRGVPTCPCANQPPSPLLNDILNCNQNLKKILFLPKNKNSLRNLHTSSNPLKTFWGNCLLKNRIFSINYGKIGYGIAEILRAV